MSSSHGGTTNFIMVILTDLTYCGSSVTSELRNAATVVVLTIYFKGNHDTSLYLTQQLLIDTVHRIYTT